MSQNNEPSFESQMKRLEEIVKALESADLSLEEGLALYKEGAVCSRYCREKLENARHEIEKWQDGAAVPLGAVDYLEEGGAECDFPGGD